MLSFRPSNALLLVFLALLFPPPLCLCIRGISGDKPVPYGSGYVVAPPYNNKVNCPNLTMIHVAMTLDLTYLRGSMAAVNSILKHADCPQNVFVHFMASAVEEEEGFDSVTPPFLIQLVGSTFPSLKFKVYGIREEMVIGLITSSIRKALDNPLNYARNYLGDLLDPSIKRVIYLDTDLILQDDIQKLWDTNLTMSRVIGAPEYCRVNFTNYFTDAFWSDPNLYRKLESRKPCYFNTGVMVMDLERWRRGNYTNKLEKWMGIQKNRRIYELGSMPPFLLEFAGNVEAIDHRWNQHGLGGDKVSGSCRSVHDGPISLLHWSGKGKPWERIDSQTPCPVDEFWAPYDLYRPHPTGSFHGSSSRVFDLSLSDF